MRRKSLGVTLGALLLAGSGWAQSTQDSTPPPDRDSGQQRRKHQPGPGREIGSGAATVGTGAAKGAGSLAKGTGKGAVDLVTLHPINAGASVGKGALVAGKDVGSGTARGTGKMVRGVGRAVKKLF